MVIPDEAVDEKTVFLTSADFVVELAGLALLSSCPIRNANLLFCMVMLLLQDLKLQCEIHQTNLLLVLALDPIKSGKNKDMDDSLFNCNVGSFFNFCSFLTKFGVIGRAVG